MPFDNRKETCFRLMTEQQISGCDIFIVVSRTHGDFFNVLTIVLFYWGKIEKVVEQFSDYIGKFYVPDSQRKRCQGNTLQMVV